MITDTYNNRIYPGSIIVVINGLTYGNRGNTITKIVFINNYCDTTLCYNKRFIVVEDRSRGNGNGCLPKTKTGKGMWYERITDIRLATAKEKEMFNKGIYSIK